MSFASFSEPFIRRPVGTTLLAIGLMLVGVVAYRFLPVASMPTVDYPTITVTANRPGADPETMAATVAAPLERRLGEIPGVTELTSRSSLGMTRISVQFDLNRNIDRAARDVQAALNAALTDLPGDLQSRPTFRKSNPAATPIMILALTSKTVPASALYDAADTVVAQRLSQVSGVAEVSVNGQASVLLVINKQSTANVIETVDRIYELIPEIKRWISPGIDISVLSDRTRTIRASVEDMQLTLIATIALVMLVVFVFLRRAATTIAAGVTVPLSLAGTCAMMWVAGFSIDNLSLMALAVSVGFVVDDAIVMIENCFRNLEKGMSPLRAAIEGAQQIGFTVLAISISLVAAFIPMLFMTGVVGRIFREFSVTLAFAIAVSTVVSLSLTPMICAHFVRKPPSPDATWLDRAVERVLGVMVRAYARSLAVVLSHRALTVLIMAATMALTAMLYVRTPKGFFPSDDTGLIYGGTRASSEISFNFMYDLQQKAEAIVRADPAVAGVGSSIGSSGWNASVN